jgi:uncharacterized membrane protein YdjX (TVP38/TMEM64 family)
VLSRLKVNRYWLFVGLIIVVFLVAYLLAEILRVPMLTDVSALSSATYFVAFLSVGLLTADVLLPIPSSLVMAADGALFGFTAGSIIALTGNVAGFFFAYWLGGRSSPLIQKFVSKQELDRGSRILRKWGVPALILTRPLPILAETITIMAGVSKLPFAKSLMAVAIGSLPASLLYAWAGSQAKDSDVTVIIFLALIGIAAVAWIIDRRWGFRK